MTTFDASATTVDFVLKFYTNLPGAVLWRHVIIVYIFETHSKEETTNLTKNPALAMMSSGFLHKSNQCYDVRNKKTRAMTCTLKWTLMTG